MTQANSEFKQSASLISIGMPVYNSARTLRSTIRSLLAQTYTNWELLLVDDGSSDETLDIAKSYDDPRIRIYSDGARLGIAPRLNQAIDVARGIYFARMDGDDIAYPTRLGTQLIYLNEHPGVNLVGAHCLVFGANGVARGKRAGPEDFREICARPYSGFPMVHPTFFGYTDWFRCYRYSESIVVNGICGGAEDQDLLLRSYRTSQFANVPEVLLGYREEGISLTKILRARTYWTIAATREFAQRKQYYVVVLAASLQFLKLIVDCVAVTTGSNYRLLRHRSQMITEPECRQWNTVWQTFNNEN
jgi:glycosyltransferase involved in cell wall biosynthesis